jgi:hypothetical protein
MLTTEHAPHALKDMISRKDNASSLNQTTPNPLISDVEYGIGMVKFA